MHLKEIQEFRETTEVPWRERLYALNIRHVEQLGSLLASPAGRYALQKLGVPVEAAQKAIEEELRTRYGLSLSTPLKGGLGQGVPLLTRLRYRMGYNAGDRDPFQDAVFDTPLPDPPPSLVDVKSLAKTATLPDQIVLGNGKVLPAADQGRRGTCAAFTVMGMYEFTRVGARLRPVSISAQYLYYRAKQRDGFGLLEEGTSVDAALQIMKHEGCCLDHHLRYNPKHDLVQRYTVKGHTVNHSEAELRKWAKTFQIASFRSVGLTVGAVKKELAEGRPVGVGLGVYELAWYNALARSRGEIALPLMDTSGPRVTILDTYLGGHAVVLVGYRDNSTESTESQRPGGGYFIFRNSWGEEWAQTNDFGEGYGCLPYEYLSRFCLEAAVIDALPKREPKTKPKKPRGGSAGKKAKVKKPS